MRAGPAVCSWSGSEMWFILGIERIAHMLTERFAAFERWILPAAILDIVLGDVEVDAVRIKARDGTHRHVGVVGKEQSLLQREVVSAGVRPCDLADFVAIHVIDGRTVADALTSACLIPTRRGWIILP